MRPDRSTTLWIITIALCFAVGCKSETADSPEIVEPASGGHDHDHAHHDHEAGPHGGHLVELPGHHAEWTHDETGLITVYLLGEDLEQEATASEVAIRTTIEGSEPKTYNLTPVSATDGVAKQFEVKSKELLTALSVGEGVKAEMLVTMEGEEHVGEIEHHSHDDHHGHAH